MIKDLSRDPDKSMLGFSREVARDVTHPLWPSRVPLSMSCSDILDICVEDGERRNWCWRFFEVGNYFDLWEARLGCKKTSPLAPNVQGRLLF